MRKNWNNLFLFLFFVAGIQAQEIQNKLYKAGFENIQVKEGEDSLKVFFEHREFRSPYHSMRYADLLLQEMEKKPLVWIPLYHNTPIGEYHANSYRFSSLSEEDRRFYRQYNSFQEAYRFHLRIHPDFSARFGYYSDPFQIKFNLILDSRIYLAPGLSLQTGIAIPIQNNLDAQDTKPRLAPSMLHYFAQPANSHFVALSLGSFYYDRYGIDLQYRYDDLSSPWSFGLESGLTGFYWMTSGSIYSEDVNNLHAIADVEYRLPFENLSVKLSAGKFLFEDLGGRVDLIRQFGTVDLGLHISATDAGVTGGFQFAFSLWPGTIIRTKKLEVRTSEEFRWEYSYNNEEPVARRYRLGIPRLDHVLRQYNAEFVKGLDGGR
ncbi:YjbH domain-containing protein [Salinimicrobium sp. TH3]|uniref:YjbH domain-containing protein n=1 Tax=Salinimicrobium sp. TH3 TaxID=2997342 RepID=UPI002273C77E|nr:YjbH domain-containing protein [Salinimicrobium sp. TH3]MCY2687783.1 YjbH domain-containing protein [Salinimicrobium sp. TH3]